MRTKEQRRQLRNYIKRNGGNLQLLAYFLFILQFQCKFNSAGVLIQVKSRYNPYNPLTYLFMITTFIVISFVVIYEEVIKDSLTEFPKLFKYN